VIIPAAAPFPVPFKPFVIAQGVFQVPWPAFLIGTLVGRGCRFLLEGLLGARYGSALKQLVLSRKWVSAAVFLGLVILFLLIKRVYSLRAVKHSQAD
jgi:undecaprenyl-diphosphatase